MRWWCLVLVACQPIVVPPKARVEIYVDGSAVEDGDGSRERPFKKLEPALQAGALVHVATGLYPVALTLPDLELVGPKSAVLYAEGTAPAVLTLSRGKLDGLSIQGGQWGVVCHGDVALDDVHFSGQRAGAVHLVEGKLSIARSSIDGTLPDTVGIRAEPHTQLDAQLTELKGALKRGVDLQDADATLSRLRSLGPKTAVHASGGTTRVSDSSAERGASAAFYVGAGRLELHHIKVIGHEYGVLAGDNSDLVIDGFDCDHAEIAAVSLVRANGSVKHLVATSPGTHGGVEALASTTTLEDVRVSSGSELGILVRQGTTTATGIVIEQLGRDGDAIQVRDAHATLSNVELKQISGFGLVSTAHADVVLTDLSCETCAHGALLCERLSTLDAKRVSSSIAPVATAGVDGRMTLEALTLTGTGPIVWAECTGNTKVTLRGKPPPADQLVGACIELAP